MSLESFLPRVSIARNADHCTTTIAKGYLFVYPSVTFRCFVQTN